MTLLARREVLRTLGLASACVAKTGAGLVVGREGTLVRQCICGQDDQGRPYHLNIRDRMSELVAHVYLCGRLMEHVFELNRREDWIAVYVTDVNGVKLFEPGGTPKVRIVRGPVTVRWTDGTVS